MASRSDFITACWIATAGSRIGCTFEGVIGAGAAATVPDLAGIAAISRSIMLGASRTGAGSGCRRGARLAKSASWLERLASTPAICSGLGGFCSTSVAPRSLAW